MKEMTPKELLKYEFSTFVEFCFIKWMQTIIARYYAWKVNKKWARYQKRLAMEKYFETKLGELYKCPSYFEDGEVVDCNCGKCLN